MKANDFRVENIVMVNGSISIVTEVKQLGLRVGYTTSQGSRNSYVDYDRIEPIKLTDDWMFMFGFEKKSAYYTIYPVSIKRQRTEYFYHGKQIYYVHQLQNLYFALTSKELRIP
jgi:hypothetical protein